MATNMARKRTGAARTHRNSRTDKPQVTEEMASLGMEEPAAEVDEGNIIHSDEDEQKDTEDHAGTALDETAPAQGQTSSPTEAPTMSLSQRYTLLSIQTFADCVVQKSPEGIFDVLARNFEGRWNLSFWLNKVGYGHFAAYGQGHDIVDYLRKTSHELFKAIKCDVGRPVARW